MASFLVVAVALVFTVTTVEGTCTGTVDKIRYSSSSNRIYVGSSERGRCVTLTDIYSSKKVPLYKLGENMEITLENEGNSTRKWLLTGELYVEDGSTLKIHDEELYILSDSNTRPLNLRGYGGNIDVFRSKIYGWDYFNKDADNDPTRENGYGRAYISCVSEVITDTSETCEGRAKENKGECRMDIIESEIGYLGYQGSEAYGLTWKVRGFCTDGSNLELFDEVQVKGDIKDSDIHHMWFGMYSYGHEGGQWINNKMHDNWEYGFDPHDDSDNLLIENNDVWNNGNHGIIASKRCNNVKIINNRVSDGVNAGIFLHRSSDYAEVAHNIVYNNGDAGLAILESFNLNVHHNTFTNNKYGIRISVGGGQNLIKKNTFEESSKYSLYTYEGSDPPYVDGNTGVATKNKFIKNKITGNTPFVIYLKDAAGTVFKKNKFKPSNSDAVAYFANTTTTVYTKNQDPKISFTVKNSCFSKMKNSAGYSGAEC